jgi:hypothetical protein
VRVTFALAFDNRAAAEQAAAELGERGFEIAALEPVTAVFEVADAEQLADLRDAVRAIADEHGGEFLGSGSFAAL